MNHARRPPIARLCFLSVSLFVSTGFPCGVSAQQPVDFQRDVRPILSETCFDCHGPDSATREAQLRLDQYESAMTVIAPGDAEASELVRRLSSDDPDERMPPPTSIRQPTAAQRETLVAWVESGAEYETHWAFRPPVTPEVPGHAIAASRSSRHPIDAFVAERLRRAGLRPSPPADLTTLIRRVTLDLTGLPPTPSEVRRFVEDAGDDEESIDAAYEALIDRLMQSPRYGEHMALPWLEASRYADTDGYQNDRYRYQHVWRDWVIKAYNDNMPYDQFVIEQLAGDMLPDATFYQQVATGFGRNHRINSEDGSIPEEWRTENVVDRVDTFGTVFLGLTIGCARCHDHKYDPISQREYYQLFAYFNNISEWGVGPNNGNSPPFIKVPKSWPELSESESRFRVPERVKLRGARKEVGNGLKRPQAGDPSTVMVMHELLVPRETYVLNRGQYNAPDTSQRVFPDVPSALQHSAGTPKNRLELARWVVDRNNPLAARVAVNRLWQQFFGAGLVESSDNFGSQGTPPTHPELLDWLASEFVDSGWNVRAIQKRILISHTYRQSSAVSPKLRRRDPNNRLLARGPRFRLPAFTLRDQALSASGLLVEKIGGPSAKPYMPPKIWRAISNNTYKQDRGENLFRRSLYTYWRRTIPPPTMMNFNAAAREVCIVKTEPTNTPLQALTLMNNTLFVESARFLAQRMIQEGPSDIAGRIDHGFRLVTARYPNQEEREVLLEAQRGFIAKFRADRKASAQLLDAGETPRDESIPAPQHAAMTMVASLILNLDETLNKE